jgi:hypothetical protein
LTALTIDNHEVGPMKSSLLILASAALLANAGIAQAAKGHGMSAPSVGFVSTPTESSAPPYVNPGALFGPTEFGTPPVNSGLIGPITNQYDDGALPGAPGSATYDPNAALPSLDNPGSALAPNPGTSAAGFGSPNTNTGTTPSLYGGGG